MNHHFYNTLPGDNGELPRLVRLQDLLGEWDAEAEVAHVTRTTGALRGPITGHPKLDRELGGALGVGVHVLHAGPGVGKTAFVLQVAAECGFPALFITCEMAPLELFRRLTARITQTFLGKLRSGELSPEASGLLARRAAQAAGQLYLVDATRAWASPEWVTQAAQAVAEGDQRLLLVVDSVHAWVDGAPTTLSEYERLNLGLSSLRNLAQTLNCPILAVAERNRASMVGGGMSASAGSRKFEFGGESVLGLERPKDTPPDAAGEVPTILTIEKNRTGSPGRKIDLRFHGALQRFREAGM